MNLDFSSQTEIFTLDDVPKGFLQVLLPEFTLTKVGDDNKARLLEIALKENLHAIVSSAGKKQFFELVRRSSAGAKQLRQELRTFKKDPKITSCRFDCASHPLRYGHRTHSKALFVI